MGKDRIRGQSNENAFDGSSPSMKSVSRFFELIVGICYHYLGRVSWIMPQS